MSKPEETTPSTPPESAVEWFVRNAPPFVPSPRPKQRRKALRIEVSQRTFDAVKANPGDLKLLAKDRHGNPVVERPARRRMSEAEIIAHNERVLKERTEDMPRRRADPGPEPRDQHWQEQRGCDGVTRYRPDDGSRNPFVTHVYDVFDVLREDD
jgi:hypothetical protein